jgi:hypothetical protein
MSSGQSLFELGRDAENRPAHMWIVTEERTLTPAQHDALPLADAIR